MGMGKLACSPLLMASGGGAGGKRLTFFWGASHQEFDRALVSTQSTQNELVGALGGDGEDTW